MRCGVQAPPISVLTPDSPGYPGDIQWALGAPAPSLALLGNPTLLWARKLALFASVRTCPELILPTFDAARRLRSAGVATIGGFQSPLERAVLPLLLRGTQVVTLCPARGIDGRLSAGPCRTAVAEGRLLVVSPFPLRVRRPSVRLAEARNRLVAGLGEAIFVVQARPGSRTYGTAELAMRWGKQVYCFDHPQNRELILLGAQPVTAARLVTMWKKRRKLFEAGRGS